MTNVCTGDAQLAVSFIRHLRLTHFIYAFKASADSSKQNKYTCAAVALRHRTEEAEGRLFPWHTVDIEWRQRHCPDLVAFWTEFHCGEQL